MKFECVVFPASAEAQWNWKNEPLVALMKQISADLHIQLPPDIEGSFTDILKAWTNQTDEEKDKKIFILLDQFEDYLLYNPQKNTFDDEFSAAVNCPDLRVNFLVSIRQDSFTKLDRFKALIPNLFNTRLPLNHLNCKAAKAAITEPIVEYNTRNNLDSRSEIIICDGLVEAILGEIVVSKIELEANPCDTIPDPQKADAFEAPLLQLAMERLWETEVELKQSKKLKKQTYVDLLGGLSQIVADHVINKMGELSLKDQDYAASVLHFLVTPSGHKIAHTVSTLMFYANEYRKVKGLDDLKEPQIQSLLDKLSNPEHRILRTIPGDGNQKRYEIFHDQLGRGILSWQSHYIREKKTEIIEKEVKEAVDENSAFKKERRQRILDIVGIIIGNIPSCQQESLRQDEKVALLACQAYLFNQDYRGRRLDQIDQHLRQAISAAHFSPILKKQLCEVSSVAFNSDSTRFISGSFDGTVQQWNLEDKSHSPSTLVRLNIERGVLSVAISSDGKKLAVGSGDFTVRLYDLNNRDSKPTLLKGHQDEVWSVAFSPDGKTLASGSWDQTVRFWNLDSLQDPPVVLENHPDWVWSVAFSPDGKTLAVGCRNGEIWLWRPQESNNSPNQILHVLANWRELDEDDLQYYGEVFSVAFSPNGQKLAGSCRDGSIRLWDLHQPDFKPDKPDLLKGHEEMVRSVAFSPNGQWLASAGNDRTIQLWSLTSPSQAPDILKGHDQGISTVAFSPDSRWLVSGSWDHSVRLWELSSVSTAAIVQKRGDPVKNVALSSDGQFLAAINQGHEKNKNRRIQLWDLQNFDRPLNPLNCGEEDVCALAFSPHDDQLLASASEDGTIKLWDLRHPENAPIELSGHREKVNSLAFSHHFEWLLASASEDSTIKLWDLRHPEQLPIELPEHRDKVNVVAFSPYDNQLLASGSDDQTVCLWNIHQLDTPPVVISANVGKVVAISLSANGQRLALGTERQIVLIYDLAPLQKGADPAWRGEYNNFKGSVIAFNPNDDQMLASGGWDGQVWLWTLEQPKSPLIKLEGHSRQIRALIFSKQSLHLNSTSDHSTIYPEGQYLISAADDGIIQLDIVDTGQLAEMVCDKVWRNLSQDEWHEYIGSDIPYELTCPRLPGDESIPPEERADVLKHEFDEKTQRLFSGQVTILDLFKQKALRGQEISGRDIAVKLNKLQVDEATLARLETLCNSQFLEETYAGLDPENKRYRLTSRYMKYLKMTL